VVNDRDDESAFVRVESVGIERRFDEFRDDGLFEVGNLVVPEVELPCPAPDEVNLPSCDETSIVVALHGPAPFRGIPEARRAACCPDCPYRLGSGGAGSTAQADHAGSLRVALVLESEALAQRL